MPPKAKSKGPVTWEAFTERLKSIYWTSLAPEARLLSRPYASAGDPVVPDDVWQAAVTIFPDAENWLHNPVPAFSGKSPIYALGIGQLAEVKQLIMSVADFFLPDPDEIVSWEDAMAMEEADQAARAAADDASSST